MSEVGHSAGFAGLRLGYRVAIIGFVLAVTSVVIAVVTGLPHDSPNGETVGSIRTLTSVTANLSSGLSIWTSNTIVFADGDRVRALEPDGSTWVVTQLKGGAEIRDVSAVPDGPLYFSSDDGKVRKYYGGVVSVVMDKPLVSGPRGVAITPTGDIYVADIDSGTVFKRAADGRSRTVGELDMPNDMTTNREGRIFVADSEGKVYEISPAGALREVFNVKSARPPAERGLPGYIFIAFTPNDDLIVADELTNTIWRVHDGASVRVLGAEGDSPSPVGVPADLAAVASPWAVVVTSDYRLIVSESGALREVQLAH